MQYYQILDEIHTLIEKEHRFSRTPFSLYTHTPTPLSGELTTYTITLSP